MNQDQEPMIRAIHNSTMAVWVVVVVGILNLLASVGMGIVPMFLASRFSTFEPSVSSSTTAPVDEDTAMPFYELPIEHKVHRATLILVTTYQPEGDRMKSVVSEVLKRDASATQKYEVGTEYAMGSHYPRPNRSYGAGAIVFFTGNSSMMQSSVSYDSSGRIGGLGDMPLTKLRELVAADAQKATK